MFGSGFCQFREKNKGVIVLLLYGLLMTFVVIQTAYTMHVTYFICSHISEAMKTVANSLGNRNNVDLFESDLDVEFLGGILSDVTLHTLAEVYLSMQTSCHTLTALLFCLLLMNV